MHAMRHAVRREVRQLRSGPDRARGRTADLSPELVGVVRERVAAAGLEDRIATAQADAQDLSDFEVCSPFSSMHSRNQCSGQGRVGRRAMSVGLQPARQGC